MEVVPVAFICLLLSAVVQLLALSNCASRAGSPYSDTQCQKYCERGQCPNFCSCGFSNATDTCAKLEFAPNNTLAINETVRPGRSLFTHSRRNFLVDTQKDIGTPIFTIQVAGQERWSYTLARDGPVDGSVWSSLSKYLKLTKIGNQYEMIVDNTPDLEDISQRYIRKIILQILPVNEHAPEFFVIPLKTTVAENTKMGTEVYLLSDHTIDLDVNPTANEFSAFGSWEYLPEAKKDGRTYFQMIDKKKGNIQVKTELDFEALQPLDASRFFLNVSASDVHGVTSYTVLTIDVEDVDDLPPEFYHPRCLPGAAKSKPCTVSYEATVPLHFQGPITNIIPGLIHARDMDSLNIPVEYSLKPKPGEKLDNGNKFSINETTGSLSVLSPFEERSETQLVIVVSPVIYSLSALSLPSALLPVILLLFAPRL